MHDPAHGLSSHGCGLPSRMHGKDTRAPRAAMPSRRTLKRILDAFREFQVGSNVFAGVDGYGHGDIGRQTLDKVYARLLGAEAALVSGLPFHGVVGFIA